VPDGMKGDAKIEDVYNFDALKERLDNISNEK
jgi:hypothetical protein